jgi:hypothetical protein
MGNQNLLSRAPPCFGKHVKPLVLDLKSFIATPVSRRVDVRQAAGRKNNCRIFITTWWKRVVPTPLGGIRVRKRKTYFVTSPIVKAKNAFLYQSRIKTQPNSKSLVVTRDARFFFYLGQSDNLGFFFNISQKQPFFCF